MVAEPAKDDEYKKLYWEYKYMQVKFAAQERPRRVVVQDANSTYARFIIEPYERVFGHSVGNALRRILLTSLETPGIISFHMEGVPHEFMAVDGITEDVTNIVLNIKGARLRRLLTDEGSVSREGRVISSRIEISQEDLDKNKGAISITLGELFKSSPFEVINPELHLFTVTKPMDRQIDFRIGFGKGYVPSERHEISNKAEGEIVLDVQFSPVVLANYVVENTRVGQDTDYDRLVLEITTDGRLTPTEALSFSAQILDNNLEVFEQLQEPELVYEDKSTESCDDDKLLEKLTRRIDEIELSVRSTNCLSNQHIDTLAELVCIPEKRMLEFRNFGKKSLYEIRAKLMDLGLSLGMDLSRFDISPDNVKDRIKEIIEERKVKKKDKKV